MTLEFNDDGLVTRITDLTKFHRNVDAVFLSLLTDCQEESVSETMPLSMIQAVPERGYEDEAGHQLYTFSLEVIALIVVFAVSNGVFVGICITLSCCRNKASVEFYAK